MRVLFVGPEEDPQILIRAKLMRHAGWTVRVFPAPLPRLAPVRADQWLERIQGDAEWGMGLLGLMRRFKPDWVHAIGISNTGGRLLELFSQDEIGRSQRWAVSPSTEDILFSPEFGVRRGVIHSVLSHCSAFAGSWESDLAAARAYGCNARLMSPLASVPPGSRGKRPGNQNSRTVFLQNFPGFDDRSFTAWYALFRCADLIRKHRWTISAPLLQSQALRIFTMRTGIKVHHSERPASGIFLRLDVRNGRCAEFSEALARGAFPVVSTRSDVSELRRLGVEGAFVHPEEPNEAVQALKKALTDPERTLKLGRKNVSTLKRWSERMPPAKKILSEYDFGRG